MTGGAWWTLFVVGTMVMALTRSWVSPVIAVLGANVLLLVSGVIDAEAAFSGFSNPAPFTIAALLVVAAAVEKTGALQPLISATLGSGRSTRSRLLRLLLPTAGASALLNNTPIVAMLAPQVVGWAERRGQPASQYLMPISFATILGGMLTVIGTSSNLVVSGLLEEHGMAPLGIFELTGVGLPVAGAGLALLVLLAPRVIPNRQTARQQFETEVRQYVIHKLVAEGGPLDGRTVEMAGLRQLQGVFLAEIERGSQTIAPAAPTTVLRGGDRLAFVGRVDLVRDLQTIRGLVSAEQRHAAFFNGGDHTFFEAVVSGASGLMGRTLKEVRFRSRFQGAVLAIHRADERVRAKLGEVKLRAGDTLLLVSDRDFEKRWKHRSEFLLVSHLGGTPPPGAKQAYWVGAVTFAIVLLAGLDLVPILQASILGSIILVLTGVLTPGEARSSIDLDTLLVIAASFGIGAAIHQSGLALLLGTGIVGGFRDFGPVGVLLAVTLATIALTQLITNNAAAVLLFPIAMSAAADIGAEPRPFAIALCIAASASFLTPIGYQTNTMVYGLGGYRFGDYARLGAPLTLVVVLMILVFVPLLWSF